jgi:hypothetical protein
VSADDLTPEELVKSQVIFNATLVICQVCQATFGVLCDNGLVHPERVEKSMFAAMTEEMYIDHQGGEP